MSTSASRQLDDRFSLLLVEFVERLEVKGPKFFRFSDHRHLL